jgi:UDP-N-acetylglucosamine transferase subunit ALG13
VLREFVAVPTAARPSPSIFVTLGTISPYRFDALLEGLETTGLPDSRTVWQVGCSGGRSLPGKQFESMPADEFEQHARAADLVVTHAGIGTILQLLEWGINPVVVPRRQSRGEHVDDHQLEVCRYLSGAGIGTVLDAAELTAERLLAATELHVQPASGSVLN